MADLRLVLGSNRPKDRYFWGGHGHFCLESGRNQRFSPKTVNISQNRPNLAARAKNGEVLGSEVVRGFRVLKAIRLP